MDPTTTHHQLHGAGNNKKTQLLRLFVVAIVLVSLTLGFSRYFDWSRAVELFSSLQEFSENHLLATLGIFVALQAVGMILSLPTKGILTVFGGALFGTWLGSAVSLLSVLAGTSLLFLAVRHVFGKHLQGRIHPHIQRLLSRISRRPGLFIAGLRMIITLPYGPITIAAALTRMRFRDFLIGSFLGDIPIIVLYSAAGSRISQLTGIEDVIAWPTAFLLVGVGAIVAISALLAGRQRVNLGDS